MAVLSIGDVRDCLATRWGLTSPTVDAAGIPAGRPRPTRAGDFHVSHAGSVVALLAWVDGRPLRGDSPDDQTVVGRTLGAVHQVLARQPAEGGDTLVGALDPDAEWLGVRPVSAPRSGRCSRTLPGRACASSHVA